MVSGSVSAAQSTPEAGTAEQVCDQYSGTPVATEVDAEPSEIDLASLEFDLIFLESMIPHHQSAIDMATVLLERTERQELRDLATAMIETQSVEIAVMSGWRQEWYADIPPLTELQLVDAMNIKLNDNPGVGGVAGLEHMGADHMAEDVREVCEAGDDVDIVFIDSMIGHHSSAIILAKAAIDRAVHREIKDLGNSIASAQQYEIDQMLAWREVWFEGTPISDHHD